MIKLIFEPANTIKRVWANWRMRNMALSAQDEQDMLFYKFGLGEPWMPTYGPPRPKAKYVLIDGRRISDCELAALRRIVITYPEPGPTESPQGYQYRCRRIMEHAAQQTAGRIARGEPVEWHKTPHIRERASSPAP